MENKSILENIRSYCFYEPLFDQTKIYGKRKKELYTEIFYRVEKFENNINKAKNNDAFNSWLFFRMATLQNILLSEIEILDAKQIYYFGCSLNLYKLTYVDRLKSFLTVYPDAIEQDFINYEFEKDFDLFYKLTFRTFDNNLIVKQEQIFDIINDPFVLKNITFSIEARNKFLNDKLNNTGTTGATQNDFLGYPTNENANKLFDFLIEFYRPKENTTVKYVNILHYLKNDANKHLYIFNIKQLDFKKIVMSKVGIKIKKFAISEKYKEVEKPILNSLEISFRNENK